MNKLPDLNYLLFDVDDNDYVYLCYGPLKVVVAHLDEFNCFADDLVYKITEIKNEIKENY